MSNKAVQDARTTNTGKRLGVAIVGLGRIGKIHMKNLISSHRVTVLYLVELDPKIAEHLIEEYNLSGVTEKLATDDADKMFNDPRVDCVFVCTPTYTHCEIVKRSFKHKKHVFCEKPVSQKLEEAIECYDAAEASGRVLFCSFNRRYDPSVCDIYNRVKKGECGQLYTIKTCSRDNPLPSMEYMKTSGGIFHDCSVHDVDMVSWIIGAYPTTVYVQGHAFNEEISAMCDVDTCVITMKYPDNTMAVIDLSRLGMYGYHQSLEVFAENGMLVSDNQRGFEVSVSNKEGSLFQPIKYSFEQRYRESYIAAVNSFFNIVQGKEPLTITKECIIRVHNVADACERSIKTGQSEKVKYTC